MLYNLGVPTLYRTKAMSSPSIHSSTVVQDNGTVQCASGGTGTVGGHGIAECHVLNADVRGAEPILVLRVFR